MPNQDILISTLGLQEAKDNCEIENIGTTRDELFREAALPGSAGRAAAKEVAIYVHALRIGFESVRARALLTGNQILEPGWPGAEPPRIPAAAWNDAQGQRRSGRLHTAISGAAAMPDVGLGALHQRCCPVRRRPAGEDGAHSTTSSRASIPSTTATAARGGSSTSSTS